MTQFPALELFVFVDGSLIESQLFHGGREVEYPSALAARIRQFVDGGWVADTQLDWRINDRAHRRSDAVFDGKQAPLWEGTDSEFAAWAQAAFGIPATIQTITVTPRTSNQIAGVAIGGSDGAIVFVLTNDIVRQQLRVDPHRLGPIADDPVIKEKAVAAGRETQIFDAVAALLKRHLSTEAALALLIPPTVH